MSGGDERDDFLGSDYAVVQLAPSWGLFSLTFFLAALAAPYWVYELPIAFRHGWQRPVLVPAATALLALLGFVVALLGRNSRRHPGLARLGLFLNGVICGLLLVLTVALMVWWTWRR